MGQQQGKTEIKLVSVSRKEIYLSRPKGLKTD